MTTRLPPQRPLPQAPAPRRRVTGQVKLPTATKGAHGTAHHQDVEAAHEPHDGIFAPPTSAHEKPETKDSKHEAQTETPKGQPQQQKLNRALQKPQPSRAPAAAAQLSGTSYANLSPVGALQQSRLTGTNAKLERPPDAFKLLKEAKDEGVLFTEDWRREGHTEDQDDPELAAAVEECIRLCFGVPGILRIGPGKDDKQAPIIVVVATHGFGEHSFARVPERVHRFETTVAIPFELLPLKRPR